MDDSVWAWRVEVPGGYFTAALLGGLLLTLLAWEFRDLFVKRRHPRRFLLLALRALLFTLGWLVAVQPTGVTRVMRPVPGQLAVLVDTSKSMAVGSAAGSSRGGRVVELLKRWASESKSDEAAYFTFGSGLEATGVPALLTGYQAKDYRSRLAAGLEALASSSDRERFSAVIVVSDGADPELAAWLARDPELPFVVHTVAVLDQEAPQDESVALHANPIGFLRDPTTLSIQVRSQKQGRSSVPVRVFQGTKLLEETAVALSAEGTGSVEVEVTPSQLGRHLFRAALVPEDGDQITENNEAAALMRVARDKVRVLLVAGKPSWDVRFLRSFFKADPAIDLISFFIMRTATDLAGANTDELALIPFPTDELFREHLLSFDLVVLQNFAFGPYRMESYLPSIRDYVLAGGGFAMVGGEEAFGSGSYQATPVAEILPVELPPPRSDPSRLVSAAVFSPLVVAQNRRHPVVELLPNERENALLWKRLAPLHGINLATPSDDAQVLLEHPSLRDGEGSRRRPVVVVAKRGEGRSAAVLADSSYRWGFTTGGQTGDPTNYQRFWDRLTRWLIRDPALDPSRLETQQERYLPGEVIQVRALLRTKDYQPVRGPARMTLSTPEGQVVETAERATDPRGESTWEFAAPSIPNGYRLAVTLADGEELAEAWVMVSSNSQELTDTSSQPMLLESMAERFSGHSTTLEAAPALSSFDLEEVEVPATGQLRPFRSIWALLGVLLLAASEWWIRRTLGFR